MSDTELKPVKGKWGKVILTLSLALNLLFVGALVGAGWMRNKHHAEGSPGFVVKRLLSHLPDDKRRSILAQITSHREVQRSRAKLIGASNRELKSALKHEPFDVRRVRAVTDKLHEARDELIGAKMKLLVNVLEQLTPDERRKILESRFFRRLFARGNRRWGPRHH